MGLIAVSEETKKRLDSVGVQLAQKREVKSVTYEVIAVELLDLYEQVEAGTLKVTPQ